MATTTAKKKAAPKKKAAAKKKSAPKKTNGNGNAKTELADILQNWNKMNDHLNKLTEDECLELLQLEQSGRRRVHMLNRIHARFTKLRSERERLAIMKGEAITK